MWNNDGNYQSVSRRAVIAATIALHGATGRGKQETTITVAIPTCNRPLDVERCLESLSRVTYPAWDVLVIDQSDDDETRRIVERFRDAVPGLRYCRMSVKGLTRARNLALELATGEILAFIDDDCVVESGWLGDVAAVVASNPDVPLIFGRVLPAPHDPKECFIPGHDITRERTLRSRPSFVWAGSLMGASMYLRCAVSRKVGPYDVHAGPGAEFNVEDRDFAYRHLRAGYPVLLTPRVTVVHYGARYYEHKGTRRILRGYGYGFGAQDMKFLRCRDSAVPLIIIGHIIKMIGFIVWHRFLVAAGRGSHVTWIVMYFYGLFAGLRVPVIRERGLWGMPDEYDTRRLLEAAEIASLEGAAED